MDFFEHQEVARKKTGWLVVLFALAVLAIIAAACAVVALCLLACGGQKLMADPNVVLGVVAGVLCVVGAGTAYKLVELRQGGKRVAESLGGQLIEPGLADPQERKLLNVVEEMAIASGTPVPPVYILPQEPAINAFAAGHTTADAVIGITRGAVDRLKRDELQGVIGHEFSHILNGDMRLNMQIMGVLHGILVIGLLGYGLVRLAGQSSRARIGRKQGFPLPLLALGVGFMIVGYVGTFFGKIIKAAVSRQREFLADASSVQFTRSPSSLSIALRKIGGMARGARLDAPNAEVASHMFFGQAFVSWMGFLFATHPDIKQRIRRIDPTWDGTFISTSEPVIEGRPSARGRLSEGMASSLSGDEQVSEGPMSRQVGRMQRRHLAYAAALVEQLPGVLKAAAREPYSARAIVYAMLLSADSEIRAEQLRIIAEMSDTGTEKTVRGIAPYADALSSNQRLPVLDLAIPALRRLSSAQHDQFCKTVKALVRADGKIDLFEWMVQKVVTSNLRVESSQAARPRVRYYGLGQLTTECSLLLSTLAYAGHKSPQVARSAFAEGVRCLEDVGGLIQILPAGQCNLKVFDATVDKLNQTAPRIKRQLVDACSATILADDQVTLRESELLRAMCAVLGCPMPPMVAGARYDDAPQGDLAATSLRS